MRVASIALACACGLLAAACGDPEPSKPATAAAIPAVAASSPRPTVPLAQGSQPDVAEQEPMDVGVFRLPQPEDTEPEPLR